MLTTQDSPSKVHAEPSPQDERAVRRRWASAMKASLQRPAALPETALLRPSRYTMTVALKDGSALLFNSVSRALCRIDPAETRRWSAWEEAGTAAVADDPAFARTLATDGYLVMPERNELEAVQVAYGIARTKPEQLSLTIAPTMACNLACGYCFQGQDKDKQKLDPRVPDAIMEFVRARTAAKALNVTWYGGEPLMAKADIFALADRFIAHCDRQGVSYSSMIVTNGYFLTAEVARQLWSRRCSAAQVTVDGVRETHDKMRPLTSGRGSFDVIMDNLKAVTDETPLGISMRVNVSRRNVGDCDALLDEMERRGLAGRPGFQLYFSPVDAGTPEAGTAWEEGLTRGDYNAAIIRLGARAREMKLSPPIETPKGFMGLCVAAQTNGYVITHRGDVHKCWETAHDATKRIGTLFEPEQLDTSINGMIWRAWSPFDNEVCSSCKILPMCGGFCGHRFIYAESGSDNALPCPDWKWSTAEYLFARAKALGVVTDADWLEGQETVTAMQSGQRHSKESLKRAAQTVLDQVGRARGEPVDPQVLRHGERRSLPAPSIAPALAKA
jgi:uncharacterized protein